MALKLMALALIAATFVASYGAIAREARSEALALFDATTMGPDGRNAPELTSRDDPIGAAAPAAADLGMPELRIGDATEFPDNTTMIIETGCWACDGDTEALYKVSRVGGGPPKVELLFEPDRSVNKGAYITSFALKPDASEIVVAVCTTGSCGGLSNPEPGAEATFYRSTDTGSSWQEIGRSNDAMAVVAITARGLVLTFDHRSYWFNDGAPVAKPAVDAQLVHGSRRSGELLWWLPSKRTVFFSESGNTIALPLSENAPEVVVSPDQPPLIVWTPEYDYRAGDAFPGYMLSTKALDGMLAGVRSTESYLLPAAWLAQGLVIASVEQPSTAVGVPIPSVIDLGTGIAHPIAGVFDPPIFDGRNRVLAVLTKPSFLRVVVEGCLPLRDRPARNGPLIACAASGALLRPTGEQRYIPGQWFTGVWLADGRRAWAPAEGLR